MIIIPKDKISRQLDKVSFVIVFDDANGNIQEVTETISVVRLISMTKEEFVTKAKNRVAHARYELAEKEILSKFSDVLDVDLEEVTE